jgi:two-component system cell cycle response regulator
MIRFQWDEGMSVGVESIDQDHRRIIDIINQLSEAFEKGSGREVVAGLFDRLEEYASTHFAREERLMEEAGFPGLQEHAAQHKSFAGKIPELRDMLLEAAFPSVALETNLFLYRWLVGHILSDDMAYTQLLYEEGLADKGSEERSAVARFSWFLGRKISLGKRVVLTMLIPVIGMFMLIWFILLQNISEYRQVQGLLSMGELSTGISSVVHQLQKERGLSAGYVGSDYESFGSELTAHRQETDRSIAEFQRKLDRLPEELIRRFVLHQYDGLELRVSDIRKQVDRKEIKLEDVVGHYSSAVSDLLGTIVRASHSEIPGKLRDSLSTLTALMNMKEQVGLERAYGTFVIERDGYPFFELQEISKLIGLQKAYMDVYSLHATKLQQRRLEKMYASDIQGHVQQVEAVLFNGARSGTEGNGLTGGQWFGLLSKKMDMLEELAWQVVGDIHIEAGSISSELKGRISLVVGSLTLVIAVAIMFSLMVSRSIISPIRQLTEAMVNLSRGDKSVRFNGRFGDDEIGKMVAAYEYCRRALLQLSVSSNISITQRDIDLLHSTHEKNAYKKLASSDSLTGAVNRRKFEEIATIEIERSGRYGGKVSLMMLDIDHFKQINDTHGHAAGDLVLKCLTVECQRIIRDFDTYARIGGEEFAILMPETSLARAADVAERIVSSVRTMEIAVDRESLRITVSAGVAELQDEQRLDDLLRQADEALYQAKESGRDRVVLSPQSTPDA